MVNYVASIPKDTEVLAIVKSTVPLIPKFLRKYIDWDKLIKHYGANFDSIILKEETVVMSETEFIVYCIYKNDYTYIRPIPLGIPKDYKVILKALLLGEEYG